MLEFMFVASTMASMRPRAVASLYQVATSSTNHPISG